MRRIQQELMKHGATLEQVNYYVRRVKECEKLSKGAGHAHHILPRNCGWWKKYDKARWNRAVVTPALHLSLHADLCNIFPDNEHLKWALKATTCILVRLEPNKALKNRNKDKIISWYVDGLDSTTIGKKIGVSDSAILSWLKNWGIKIRYGGASTRIIRIKNTRKQEIISRYESGESAEKLGHELDIYATTIVYWLRDWGIKIRTCGQSITKRPRERNEKIISRYLSGESGDSIAKDFKVCSHTIRNWLRFWGIKLRKTGPIGTKDGRATRDSRSIS